MTGLSKPAAIEPSHPLRHAVRTPADVTGRRVCVRVGRGRPSAESRFSTGVDFAAPRPPGHTFLDRSRLPQPWDGFAAYVSRPESTMATPRRLQAHISRPESTMAAPARLQAHVSPPESTFVLATATRVRRHAACRIRRPGRQARLIARHADTPAIEPSHPLRHAAACRGGCDGSAGLGGGSSVVEAGPGPVGDREVVGDVGFGAVVGGHRGGRGPDEVVVQHLARGVRPRCRRRPGPGRSRRWRGGPSPRAGRCRCASGPRSTRRRTAPCTSSDRPGPRPSRRRGVRCGRGGSRD